jgi:hypothetical protein
VGVGKAPEIDARPCPTFTTIAPPAASMYVLPVESVMVAPLDSTAIGGSAMSDRRKTRPALCVCSVTSRS